MDQPGELIQPKPPEKQEQKDLFDILSQMLQQKQQQVVHDFKAKHKQFNQWLTANNHQLVKVQGHLVRFVLASGFSASIIIATALPGGGVQASPPAPTPIIQQTPFPEASSLPEFSGKSLHDVIASYKSWPSTQLETELGIRISNATHIQSTAVLDGHKMNKSVGLMGAEQHLYRYPGDTLEDHVKTPDERAMYYGSGIAPGLGAWGYFAPSKAKFTADDEAREKWYVVAQTFLFPGYYSDRSYRDWLKYRKVLVYNPQNGQAVVGDIGDSGPATWTGKTYGGSPEVMQALGLGGGPRKGEVIVLFIDDPNNTVPLGPVTMPTPPPTTGN